MDNLPTQIPDQRSNQAIKGPTVIWRTPSMTTSLHTIISVDFSTIFSRDKREHSCRSSIRSRIDLSESPMGSLSGTLFPLGHTVGNLVVKYCGGLLVCNRYHRLLLLLLPSLLLSLLRSYRISCIFITTMITSSALVHVIPICYSKEERRQRRSVLNFYLNDDYFIITKCIPS